MKPMKPMKIVLVIDQFDSGNNGTTVTARRYAEQLQQRGHTVTVLACGESGMLEDGVKKVGAPENRLPLVDGIIKSQGMQFARPVDEAYYQAFKGADIVHFYLPFRFCRRGEEIARQMHIPTVAAFHMQPENVTFTIGMGNCRPVNDFLYGWCYREFYNRFSYIHCPSQFIADQLREHGYDANLCVISNGVDDAFVPRKVARPPAFKDKFVILMVGRLSAEKRQDLIIEAAKRSRYRDRIQLIFAGRGPKEADYRQQGASLPNRPSFGFFEQEELVKLMNACDLYIHASDAEIEGISCMEALACGLVPVISDSKRSATNQYALDERSLFRAGDADSLAQKIDYWIEHPEERADMGREYARVGDGIRVSACVEKAEKMYRDAIQDYHDHGYRHPRQGPIKRLLHPNTEKMRSAEFEYCPAAPWKRELLAFLTTLFSPLLFLINTVYFGFTVEGRRYLEEIEGGVTVMNHVHPMDCTMVKLATFPRRTYFISLRRNLDLPFTGWLVRLFGGVPIPDTPKELVQFQRQIEEAVLRGDLVHFYPEGQLVRYHESLREFHRGAFFTAVRTGRPILPMVMTYRRPGPLLGLFKKKPCMRLLICAPQYADPALSRNAAVQELMERTRRVMEERANGPTPDYQVEPSETSEAYN
ncbi:MAG TPA: glycosyltransferase [Firmicutes bacterium]|nr:glycosyltransferase [Bacillota bacterium]